MNVRWGVLMIPSTLVSLCLLTSSQYVFLRMSFFRDRGFGLVESSPTFANYFEIASDPFYYAVLGLTFQVALTVMACSLLVGYPVAYVLTRIPPRVSSIVLSLIVASSLVSEVIKVLGLIVIFSADGLLNCWLTSIFGLSHPVQLIGNVPGVVVGMLHFTLGFTILSIFTVLQTIPRSLEEAARVHGANMFRVFYRVLLPLSLPGTIVCALVVFNMSMGAFTAVSLLGGGRILTLPVVIERTMILETKYAMAACLAAILLGTVSCVNAVVALCLSNSEPSREGGLA